MSDNPRVYIPSRGRPENVDKLVKAWDNELFDVFFMVEPDEVEVYYDSIPRDIDVNVVVLALPDKNLGVGFSRATCVEHADGDGYESIILSDDDIRPVCGMDHLVEDVKDSMALAITSYHSYLDFALNVKGKDRDDIVMSSSSFMRMWSVNIANVKAIGGLDKNLKCIDDNELKFRGAMNGFPWLIHFAAKSASFGKRFAVGGVSELGSRAVDDAADQIIAKYPEHVPHFIKRIETEKAIQYKWAKIHDHFMPEWRDWSLTHGGDINNYFGAGWRPYGKGGE